MRHLTNILMTSWRELRQVVTGFFKKPPRQWARSFHEMPCFTISLWQTHDWTSCCVHTLAKILSLLSIALVRTRRKRKTRDHPQRQIKILWKLPLHRKEERWRSVQNQNQRTRRTTWKIRRSYIANREIVKSIQLILHHGLSSRKRKFVEFHRRNQLWNLTWCISFSKKCHVSQLTSKSSTSTSLRKILTR